MNREVCVFIQHTIFALACFILLLFFLLLYVIIFFFANDVINLYFSVIALVTVVVYLRAL